LLAPTLPANTRLGWKGLTVANIRAHHDRANVIAVKSFIVQGPGEMLSMTDKGSFRDNKSSVKNVSPDLFM
jgi:hypothetical protein